VPTNLLDRRRFLVLTGGASSALVLGASSAAADVDPAPFTLGVASGDPSHDSVVLWTRLAPDPTRPDGGMPAQPVTVRWEVARDERFRAVLRRGEVVARPESAHSVHVVADRIGPNRWYYYRFEVDGSYSRIGRTRTLPTPGYDAQVLRFATASCQSWAGGRYSSWRDLAEHDLDLVLHLGDYIYETANGSLQEFRRLHTLYKTSPDLREAHARFPFFTIWDDHEVLNNWADDHKSNPDGRPFPERRRDAFQAYYEHLPLRTAPQGPDFPMYRRFRWGKLAEFSVLDTRQYRDAQACGDGIKAPCDDVFDPERTLMGPEQERWLLDGLAASNARWNVLAQQTILAPFDYDLGPGLTYNLDQWDGYPAARQRILDAIAAHRPSNPVVLSGDWHSHWVNDVYRGEEIVAAEFVGTSISSGIGWDADVRQGLAANPHVRFYNGSYRGYQLFEVTPERWQTTLRVVASAGDGASPAYTIAAYEVRSGEPGVRRLDEGDGLAGVVTSGGQPVPNAEIVVRRTTGTILLRTWTDPKGEYLAFVPPGSYLLEAHAIGYVSQSRSITVVPDASASGGFSLERVTAPFAGTGLRVPGPTSEGGPQDVVIGNGLVALTLANVFNDPQLPNATRGKPIDLGSVGHLDQLDWCNLPYVASSVPTGTEAWQRGLVRSTSVVVDGTTVRVVGAAGEVPGVGVESAFAVTSSDPWVSVNTTLTNTSAAELEVWVGDAMDHDGAGQRSGVPGHGTITTPYASPAQYQPARPWIGMTGSDRQTYGILYADGGFVAYGNGNWIQSRFRVVLPAGGTWSFARRIAAVDSGTGPDPFAVLDSL
jgi:phosphodiesterase/alkaline phosphatase D-like protein